MSKPRIVITGATGWLGQESLNAIHKNGKLFPGVSLELFASKDGEVSIQGKNYKVNALETLLDLAEEPTLGVIHLAFLTRNKTTHLSLEDYVLENLQISSQVSSFVRSARPKWVVNVSSGAVEDNSALLELDMKKNPYGFGKHLEELLLNEVCSEVDANLVIGRLWGGTGGSMPLNSNYAVSDFIQSALRNSQIKIDSPHRVQRRYVNAEEFMTLLLKIALSGESKVLDSGGPLVEIGELAKEIARQLPGVNIYRPPATAEFADTYFPTSDEYEKECAVHGISPLKLEDQVRLTIQNHRKLMQTFD